MKKIMLFAITGIILFCIASTSMVQAMQHRAQGHSTSAPAQISAVLSAFDQKILHDLRLELDNPDFKDTLITGNIQELHGTAMAQAASGGASGVTSSGISRSGTGRSKMREYNAKNKKAEEEEEQEEGWPQEEYPKGEYPKGEYPQGEYPQGEWGDAEYPED